MPTWTDSQIDRWLKDAEEDIVAQVSMRFESFSLPIVSGTGTYTFNQRIYKPISVTWKGKPLAPYIGRELDAIEPKFRTLQGEPRAYQMSRDGISVIRLMPIPNESLDEYDSGLYSTNIENAFIIRAFTFPNRDLDYFQIPSYLLRNLTKCYTLARAFHAEGPGQNLKAADFYQRRYMALVDYLRSVRANYYSTKERLNIEELERDCNCQKKRPRLPFGFTIRGHVFPLNTELFRSDLNSWNDSIDTDLAVDASVEQESVSDDLNNWDDTASAAFIQGFYSLEFGDDLNSWNDVGSAQLVDLVIPLTQTASDTLNNWNDAASRALLGLVDFAPKNSTGLTLPSPFVFSSSTHLSATYDSWKAFDSSGTSTYWLGTNGGVDWLKMDTGGSYKAYSYSIQVNTIPEPNRAPKNWTFEGSNNDSTWDVLHTATNQTAWGDEEKRDFTCDVYTTFYRYFRVNVTANNGDATYTQCASLYVYHFA